jgi:hypothetical protein
VSEGKIWREIRDKLSRGVTRLFRNEVGNGVAIRHKHAYTRQAIITACIELAQKMGGSGARIHFGLTVGSGDLIGLETVVITPEMVGTKIAVFLSCETKTATGSVREGQANWQKFVNSAGGIAVIARSVEDAEKKIAESVDKLLRGEDSR